MGHIADQMTEGQFCAECGTYLEPKETVYLQSNYDKTSMPKQGPYGIPVICESCFKYN